MPRARRPWTRTRLSCRPGSCRKTCTRSVRWSHGDLSPNSMHQSGFASRMPSSKTVWLSEALIILPSSMTYGTQSWRSSCRIMAFVAVDRPLKTVGDRPHRSGVVGRRTDVGDHRSTGRHQAGGYRRPSLPLRGTWTSFTDNRPERIHGRRAVACAHRSRGGPRPRPLHRVCDGRPAESGGRGRLCEQRHVHAARRCVGRSRDRNRAEPSLSELHDASAGTSNDPREHRETHPRISRCRACCRDTCPWATPGRRWLVPPEKALCRAWISDSSLRPSRGSGRLGRPGGPSCAGC